MRICIMNYKNYNLLLKAIIKYVDAIKNKNIPEKDIRIFEQINDIIYILISKEYNTPELYKELEQMSYVFREKYNKELSQSIYVDFFNNFYGNEEELKEEINIGMVIEELNIKDIREKLKRIERKELFQKILRNRAYSYKNVEELDIDLIRMITPKVSIISEPHNNLNNNEIEYTKSIYWYGLDDNETHKFQPH